MATLILLRHGESTANASGLLAGRMPGVSLNDRGREQAGALPARLAELPLAAAVSSPLQRCQETLAPLLSARPEIPLHTEERISECDYGEWAGRKLAELMDEPMMTTVQQHPSAASFPGGESMRGMQARAVEAVREWNAWIDAEHGAEACYVVCSHGDIIKSLVADALGAHLDLFQRIAVAPCSVTAIRYTPLRPFLLRLGDTGELGSLAPAEEPAGEMSERSEAGRSADSASGDAQGHAAVGGGT